MTQSQIEFARQGRRPARAERGRRGNAAHPPLILRRDITGLPVTWVPWQTAITLYCRDLIAWTAGERTLAFHGGYSRYTGERSRIEIHSIIAVRCRRARRLLRRATPPLTNRELFLRDAHLCMYCGREHEGRRLTRDHVIPFSRGGKDCWSNVVTACHGCNTRKGGQTPEEAGMSLLAVPFVPNWAEYLALSNRRILADQMAFLKAQFRARRRGLPRQ